MSHMREKPIVSDFLAKYSEILIPPARNLALLQAKSPHLLPRLAEFTLMTTGYFEIEKINDPAHIKLIYKVLFEHALKNDSPKPEAFHYFTCLFEYISQLLNHYELDQSEYLKNINHEDALQYLESLQRTLASLTPFSPTTKENPLEEKLEALFETVQQAFLNHLKDRYRANIFVATHREELKSFLKKIPAISHRNPLAFLDALIEFIDITNKLCLKSQIRDTTEVENIYKQLFQFYLKSSPLSKSQTIQLIALANGFNDMTHYSFHEDPKFQNQPQTLHDDILIHCASMKVPLHGLIAALGLSNEDPLFHVKADHETVLKHLQVRYIGKIKPLFSNGIMEELPEQTRAVISKWVNRHDDLVNDKSRPRSSSFLNLFSTLKINASLLDDKPEIETKALREAILIALKSCEAELTPKHLDKLSTVKTALREWDESPSSVLSDIESPFDSIATTPTISPPTP